MNVSYAWLRDYVATRTKPLPLAEKFQMTSSALEGMVDWSEQLAGLIVGKVLKVEPHPNAERLRIATVDTGSGKKIIVCGAPNLAEGQSVVVALPGVKLHPVGKEPFTIEKTAIRGSSSEGMLCTLEEIGVAMPADGIFIFDKPIKPGTSASEALFENDTVLDLEITPNRPDLLSHLGLAREVATFEEQKLLTPPQATLESGRQHSVEIELKLTQHKECHRYTGLALEVTVGTSPWWMQSRLMRCGVRPINSIVDVTNYVMLELGQPLHAFDLDKLPKKGRSVAIGVRTANPGEEIVLLDETVRQLHADDIVITDGKDTPIHLAGIMGGRSSAVSETTTRVLLEAATFSSSHIRRTSRRLGLRTEASLRFEKGLDSEMTDKAIKRVVYLLQELGEVKVISKLADSKVHAAVHPMIKVTFDGIQQLLGVRITASDCKAILKHLGFSIQSFTKAGFTVTPPSWRQDIAQAEDVIEELIRIWGYERLPYTLPSGPVKTPHLNRSVSRKYTIRHALAGAGLHETLHQTFSSEVELKRCGFAPEQAVALRNPLSLETAYLNPSHTIPLLADCGSLNGNQAELKLYEIGKTFSPPTKEQETLTILVRTAKPAEQAVRAIKTTLNRMARVLSLPEPSYSKGEGLPYAAAGHTLDIQVGEQVVGQLALVSSEVVAANKIRQGRGMVIAEINLERLLELPTVPEYYQPTFQYPVSQRDLTVTVPRTVSLADIMNTAKQVIDSDIVRDWQIGDIFTGKPLSEDRQAITLHLTYNSPERTLSDEEIKTHHSKLEKALQTFN